jgi:hypothetical protein
MKISCIESVYFSASDERAFYQRLKQLPELKNISGSLDRIELDFDDPLSEESLRELLALFHRYDMDMRPLGIFLCEANREWFYERKLTYWHRKIWNVTPLNASCFTKAHELVFCSPHLDPDVISETLGLIPSYALKLGGLVDECGQTISPSQVGIWKLRLVDIDRDDPFDHRRTSLEDQVQIWLEFLEPKVDALVTLKARGYGSYLSCKVEKGERFVCIDPEDMGRLGKLHIALSVWLDD